MYSSSSQAYSKFSQSYPYEQVSFIINSLFVHTMGVIQPRNFCGQILGRLKTHTLPYGDGSMNICNFQLFLGLDHTVIHSFPNIGVFAPK